MEEHHAHHDAQSQPLLHCAVALGHMEVVRYLASPGPSKASIDEVDGGGEGNRAVSYLWINWKAPEGEGEGEGVNVGCWESRSWFRWAL